MAKPRKHYGNWRIRWIDSRGKRRSEVYEDYSRACSELRRHEQEAEDGTDVKNAPKTFADLCTRWETFRVPEKRSGNSDVSIIRRHLRPVFGGLAIADVSVERVEEFKAGWTQHPKTLNNVLTLLVTMLNYAVELEWIDRHAKIRKRKIVEVESYAFLRTSHEIARFLEAASSEEDETPRALYATAIYTGMRAGELAGLLWDDVDLAARRITVRHSYEGPTKAGYVRHVPILDPLVPVLAAWKLRAFSPNVFTGRTGKPLIASARIFQDVFQRVHKRACGDGGEALAGMTFHDLRHTFASHWVMNGGDLFKLQKIGGWKSYAMVQRYAHLAPDAFTADYSRIPSAKPSAPVIPLDGPKMARSV